MAPDVRITRRSLLLGAAATVAAGYELAGSRANAAPGADEEWPAVIIGSGYGGSPSAA